MSTSQTDEKVLFQDDSFDNILVTDSRITFNGSSHTFAGITDVRFENVSKVIPWAFFDSWSFMGVLAYAGLMYLSGLFLPLALAVLMIPFLVWVKSRGKVFYTARITLIGPNRKVVCYEALLGDYRDVFNWDEQNPYRRNRQRAQAVANAIGVAIGSASPEEISLKA